MRALGLILATVMLAGCAGPNVPALIAALAKDPADVCATITTAFPPYAGTATVCRVNDAGGGVSVDKNGVMTITHTPPGVSKP